MAHDADDDVKESENNIIIEKRKKKKIFFDYFDAILKLNIKEKVEK